MRIFYFILLFFALQTTYAQSGKGFQQRAKSGKLTLDECIKITNDGRRAETVPSLLVLRDEIENRPQFDDYEYYLVIISLHYHYIETGDLAKCRTNIDRAIDTYMKRSIDPNNDYSRFMWCAKGQIEANLKNYGQALYYYNSAQVLYENANDHSDYYVVLLTNMAVIYKEVGNFLPAKLYMDEAIEQYEELHGNIYTTSDAGRIGILNEYGYILYAIKHYDEAIKCFKYVIDHYKEASFDFDFYSLASNNLARIYMEQGNWSEAAKIFETINNTSNERNYVFKKNQSVCYLNLKDYKRLETSIIETNEIAFGNVMSVFSNFTEVERENYWSQVSFELTSLNNWSAFLANTPELLSVAYDNTLFCKSFLLESSRIIDKLAMSSDNSTIQQEYKEYKRLRAKHAYKTSDQSESDSILWKLNKIEQHIIGSLGNLGQTLQEKEQKWSDVQSVLDGSDAAIEFCLIPIGDLINEDQDLEYHYGAFIVRKGYKAPRLVLLANTDSIEDLFHNQTSNEFHVNEIYQPQKSRMIYDMIWSKLNQYVGDASNIYYSTSGLLANINFDILTTETGEMLNEKYHLFRVSSTANIEGIKKCCLINHKNAVLYGNIEYDEPVEKMAEESSKYNEYTGTSISNELSLRSENERGKWGVLPSTKKEIDNIKDILVSAGIETKTIEDISASEESFKALDGKSPDILHFATHGFVIDSWDKAEENKFVKQTNSYSQKESYMMWSGLLMAGANNIWQGKFDMHNIEDGVLTADEISRMDLKQTKMVVLSACETAKGKIDYIDGVFGLQRGFKKAGAGTIVMSLWKVQDDATSMLMTTFYRNLLNGEERHKALWNAMMEVRKVYDDPYYWGGFIMLD